MLKSQRNATLTNLSVFSGKSGPLDLLSHGVSPVQHAFIIVDSQTTRLAQVSLDDRFLQRSSHCCAEDLPRCAEPPPVRVIQ